MKKSWISIILLVFFATLTFLVAQTPTYNAYIWIKGPTGFKHIPITGITITEDGKSATIISSQYLFTEGLNTITIPGQPTQVKVDTAYILYRANPPSQSGNCSLQGTGAMAFGDSSLYICGPDPDNSTTMIWWKAPMSKDF